MKTIKRTLTIALTVLTITFIFTSKIGTVVNSNYIEFKDETGYYDENKNYTGKYKLFPFLKISDLFNSEL